MRKRLITICLAGMLMAAIPAVADETVTEPVGDGAEQQTAESSETAETEPEVIYMSVDDIDPRQYKGKWVDTGYLFQLYIPSGWEELPLTAEDAAKRLLYEASDVGRNYSVAVSGTDAAGMDLDQLYQTLSGTEDYHDVCYANVNGIEAVSYHLMTKEYVLEGLAFFDDAGNVYFVVVGPMNDENFIPRGSNILASVSLIDKKIAEADAGGNE